MRLSRHMHDDVGALVHQQPFYGITLFKVDLPPEHPGVLAAALSVTRGPNDGPMRFTQ